jgi:hypothetical protein
LSERLPLLSKVDRQVTTVPGSFMSSAMGRGVVVMQTCGLSPVRRPNWS